MKSNRQILSLLNKPVEEYEKFHEKTKVTKLLKDRDSRYWPEEWRTIYYKAYARFEEIKLPAPQLSQQISLKNVIAKRQSSRRFSESKPSLKEISTFLSYSAGLSTDRVGANERRFYPSGGGRFPLEVYLISNNTELPNGVYHYYVKNNSLEKLPIVKNISIKKFTNQHWAEKAACIVVFTAVFNRNTNKYGNRGYRLIMQEAGHLGQNMYFMATALGLGICSVAGFADDKLNEILGVDGSDESVVYMMALGKGIK